MKITIGKNSGFCFGVKRAVDLAIKVRETQRGNVYILGDLIHNSSVSEMLNSRGIKKINDINEAESGSSVIIRSHGEGEETYLKAQKIGVIIHDATCVYVQNIHKKVTEYFNSGYHIIIIGNPNHPEVLGINGWCKNLAQIIDSEETSLKVKIKDKTCIVVQTTFPRENFNKIIKNLVIDSEKIVEVFDTICYTTIERQAEAKKLAEDNDMVIVIGSKNSSNTRKLYEICTQYCKQVIYAESETDINYETIKRYKKIAIVAGASTPKELIKEVYLRMEQKINAVENMTDENVSLEAAAISAPVSTAAVTVDKAVSEPHPMAQVLEEMDKEPTVVYKRGQTIKATVSLVTDEYISVAIGARKSDVQIDKTEIEKDGSFNKENFNIGDIIEVVVKNERPLEVSRRLHLINAEDDALIEDIKNGKEFSVKVVGSNKGGLNGKFGSFTVFIPASHIRLGFVKPEEFEKYNGKELRLKLVEVKGKNLIASARKVIEEERRRRDEVRKEAISAFFDSIDIGQIVEGKVVRFTDFGAFVSVNGFDCLAHISDLAWTNVKKAEDILSKDTLYEFVVLKIDREKEHVSLGFKQLQPKPWDLVADKYPAGSTIKGKVVRLAPFGAFVEVEAGIDGLVHVSQITHDWIENPASALKVGDIVDAKVIEVKPEAQKLTLSIKALMPEPEGGAVRPPKAEQSDASAAFEKRRERKPQQQQRGPRRERDDSAPREWQSDNNSGASIGDLLKDLNLDFGSEE